MKYFAPPDQDQTSSPKDKSDVLLCSGDLQLMKAEYQKRATIANTFFYEGWGFHRNSAALVFGV